MPTACRVAWPRLQNCQVCAGDTDKSELLLGSCFQHPSLPPFLVPDFQGLVKWQRPKAELGRGDWEGIGPRGHGAGVAVGEQGARSWRVLPSGSAAVLVLRVPPVLWLSPPQASQCFHLPQGGSHRSCLEVTGLSISDCLTFLATF